jgi:hypothetical protein
MFVNQNPSLILKNEVWEVDETMRKRAEVLVSKYTDQVGHIDLRHVVFVRVEGKKTKWLGKCYKIQPPYGILPAYTLFTLGRLGSLAEVYEDLDLFNIQYIIAMNRDNLALIPKNVDKVIDILILHELMHIDYGMEKVEQHDSEDFKWLLRTFGVDWANGEIKQDPTEPIDFVSQNRDAFPQDTMEYIDPKTGEVIKRIIPPPPKD